MRFRSPAPTGTGLVAERPVGAIAIPGVTPGSDVCTRDVPDVRQVLCPLRAWDDGIVVELIVTRTHHA
jgi:hypothetical protein